ncbi:MAG: PHP domain-containing protein [bacterium]
MAQSVESGTREEARAAGRSAFQSASGRADLHTHTVYSDGALSSQELVTKAHEAGFAVISITDHDNIGALDEAIGCGTQVGIEVIPGVELSVAFNDRDIHLLAYFIDFKNKDLLDYLTFFQVERFKRAERIVGKLNKLNIPITMDGILKQSGLGSVGRPHIAYALLEGGWTSTYQEAFERFIGVGGPAYEKKYQLAPHEALQLISQAGGLSFLAHPGKYTSEFEISQFIKLGLDGIEVVHPSHDERRKEYYRSVINQYFLLESGGSDFHGGKKNDDYAFGTFTVSMQVVEAMKKRLFC